MFTKENANIAREKGLETRRNNSKLRKEFEKALLEQNISSISDALSVDVYQSVLDTVGIIDITPEQKRELAISLIKEMSVCQYKSKLAILEKLALQSKAKELHDMTFEELASGRKYNINELDTAEMKSKFSSCELLALYEIGRENEQVASEMNRLI
ncbi:TPA: hypothetical protein KDX48_002321 [Vibrio parahaemolyticus]|nr:hypothetical protein [Vibrio parahaemolyticus]